MEFIHLFATDTYGKDNDIATKEADEAVDFHENSFYRAVDNSLDNKKNNESDSDSDWLINKDTQVENYTPSNLINPEYDELSNEKD